MEKQSPSVPSNPLVFIWFALKPYRKWFFLAMFFVIFVQIVGGLQSYVLKEFVDSAQAFSTGNSSTRPVFFWLMAFPLLGLFYHMGYRVSGFAMNIVNARSRAHALRKLFDYLSLHSISYFNDRLSGALSEKANNVAANVSRLLSQFMWSILNLFVAFFITSFLLYKSSRGLAVIFVCLFVFLMPFNFFLNRKQKILSEKNAEASSKVRGEVIDTVTNITAVQQYSRRFFEMFRIDSTLKKWESTNIGVNNYRERVLAVNAVIIISCIGAILWWSLILWSREALSTGSLIMIATLINNFTYSLTFIGQNLSGVMEAYGEMLNGLKDIVRPHEIVDSSSAKKLVITEGRVEFTNVSFDYGMGGQKVFENLNLKVKGGERIGIVGTSGAGKTTLMKLLLRQHDLPRGEINIDGQNIREVSQENLREGISIVPQEPMLFHRTIRENIMYGKLDATEEEMIEVAKKAQAHDFIEQLPQKYDSLVGERGVKLSVGQRQRIAIARAFLKNAPILILDEATSALDSESEVAVQKALQALMEGKTVFAIAHRLSTLREMDRIIVLKNGEIVEGGSHTKLLKNKDGVYASLWAHQAGGFIKED